MRADTVIRRKSGILLDLSLGGTPQPNSVTCGELKMNPLALPFPLPDRAVHTAVFTHVIEYLEPSLFWRWMDELHRVMRPGGIVYASGPYGGDDSHGWLSDPTHRLRVVDATFAWLDPRLPFRNLHASLGRPTPKPWHVLQARRAPGTHGTVSYEVILQAMSDENRASRNGHRKKAR